MKSLMLTAVLLICTMSIFASSSYNMEINKAEIEIANKNYQKAQEYFIAAFKINQQPNAIDLQNALVNAIKVGSKEYTFGFAGTLASLGVCRKYFEQSIFSKIRLENNWGKILNAAQEAKEKMEKSSIELHQMQKEYGQIIDLSFTKGISMDSLQSLTNRKRGIEKRLLEIFNSRGYLSEYELGVHIEADTFISDPIFSQIIKTSYIRELDTHEAVYFTQDVFHSILDNAEKQGHVRYDYIERVVLNSSVDSLRLPTVYKLYCGIYLCPEQKSISDRIDSARKLRGLSTYSEYLKKIKYSVDNKSELFDISPVKRLLSNPLGMDTNERVLQNCSEVAKIPGCNSAK